MDVLRKNASLALPVILTRLKQKQEEWLRCRADTKKAWAEIYAKNYHKSLDHRSFYFKQQDSKSLSAKALLAEIKEISENKSVEDNIRQCIAPGKKQNAIPHQEYKYSDLDIHEDLYQLMSYVVSQSGSPDQIDKAMRIWITFVEPMLGVPPRVSCVSDQDATKRSSRASISGSTAVRRSDGKLAKDGDEVYTEKLGSSRTSLLYVNNGVKENGLSNTNEHNLIPSVSIASDTHVKIERETTGELLPNRDSKKDNCAAYSDHGSESSHKSKEIIMTKIMYQNNHQQGGLENKAGVNTFENGDDSGSESDDAEDFSPEEHDNNGESEGVVDGMGDDTCPVSEHFLKRMKPLMLHVPATLHSKANKSRVFYGNDDFYVFFRLHQILYSRLEEAKEKSLVERWRGSNDTTPTDSYARFLDLLYSFLDGAIDSAKYEDECRTVLGTWSFPVFTLDKLIDKLTKLLLSITMDDVNNKLLDLFAYECLRKTERFVDELYNANASVIVNDSKIFRFECSSIPETCRQTQLTIQILNFGYEKSEPSASMMDPNFAAYLRTQLLSVDSLKKRHRIFLKRNKGKYTCDDEDLEMTKAMEGFHILNGLEFKIAAFTHKIYYLMGTSDSLVRFGRKRFKTRMLSHERANSSNGLSLRAMKFRNLLVSRIQSMEIRHAV